MSSTKNSRLKVFKNQMNITVSNATTAKFTSNTKKSQEDSDIDLPIQCFPLFPLHQVKIKNEEGEVGL